MSIFTTGRIAIRSGLYEPLQAKLDRLRLLQLKESKGLLTPKEVEEMENLTLDPLVTEVRMDTVTNVEEFYEFLLAMVEYDTLTGLIKNYLTLEEISEREIVAEDIVRGIRERELLELQERIGKYHGNNG